MDQQESKAPRILGVFADPDIFPRTLVEELLGYEYFVPMLPSRDGQTELLPMPGALPRSLQTRRTQARELRRLEAHRRG